MQPITDVVVVGAGPTGLLLAGELAREGIGCRVLERRSERTPVYESRALAVHARTLEALDMRGLADELVGWGYPAPPVRLSLGSAAIDLSALDTRFPQLEIVPQGRTEAVLEASAIALGARVERGVRVVDVRQAAPGDDVEVVTDDGRGERSQWARWVVGCDGARSTVRSSLGIAFDGSTYPWSFVLADVRLAKAPADPVSITVARGGLAFCAAFGTGWYRLGLVDRSKPWSAEPVTLDEVAETLARIVGYDPRPTEPLWTARFRIEQRQAAAYRVGRVLLAGDAAHIHSPLGGQGLNLGLQEAMNLGWKLAATVRGEAPAALLDTYEEERRRVSASVVRATDIATRAMTTAHPVVATARRVVVPAVLRSGRRNRFVAGLLSGIGTRYLPAGRRSPAGRRLPDVAVTRPDGAASSLFRELRGGRLVLVDGAGGKLAAAAEPWRERVDAVRAVDAVDAVGTAATGGQEHGFLSRPDGYCAWRGSPADVAGLVAALRAWCAPVATDLPRQPARPEASGQASAERVD